MADNGLAGDADVVVHGGARLVLIAGGLCVDDQVVIARNEARFIEDPFNLGGANLNFRCQFIEDTEKAASRAVAFENGEVDVLPGGSVENWDVKRLTEMEGVCSTG